MNVRSAGAGGCRVENAEALPPESGGEPALCAAIREAVAAQGIGQAYSVTVRVLGPSMLAASITTATGETLPEQKLAASDRPLNAASFERFARVLALQLAQAASR